MDTIKISIRVKYAILVVGLVSTVVISLFYIQGSNTNDLFGDILKIVGAGIALTMLVYTSVSLNYSYKVQLDNFQLKKKIQSIDILSEVYSSDLATYAITGLKLRTEIKELDSKAKTEYIFSNDKYLTAIISIMNYFEKVAVAVKNDVVDEYIIKDYLREAFSSYLHNYSDFIEKIRAERQSQDLWRDFQKYAIKWNVSE